jgi:hypothetical protein
LADITPALTLDFLRQFNVVVCLGPVGVGGDGPASEKLAGLVPRNYLRARKAEH